MIKAIILAGGSGSRLWPMSRAGHPKQFLSLSGQTSMLRLTCERLDLVKVDSITVICNQDHRFFVAEQLRGLDTPYEIILEPKGRNTAPAIALAAFNSSDDDVLLTLPADHLINDDKVFADTINATIPNVDSGKLVTFGIVPTSAQTGYGYIKKRKEQSKRIHC